MKIVSLFYIGYFAFSSVSIAESFFFNKRTRDVTNALITASFSPIFDKWINGVSSEFEKDYISPHSDDSISVLKDLNINEKARPITNSISILKTKNTEYISPIYDIIKISEPNDPFKQEMITKSYCIIETDPSTVANNALSLKTTTHEGAFIITGELMISILLLAILLELQKLTLFQRKL
jgi:hypothetical protein